MELVLAGKYFERCVGRQDVSSKLFLCAAGQSSISESACYAVPG